MNKYINAAGWGIKKSNFSNWYGDIYVLLGHFNKDGSLKNFSTIKSNGGGAAKHYVRFLSEKDAQNFIDNYLAKNGYGNDFVPYKSKTGRILKLIDKDWKLYCGGFAAPTGIEPAYYDGAKMVRPQFDIEDINIEQLKELLGELKNKGEVSYRLDRKSKDFFFTSLGIEKDILDACLSYDCSCTILELKNITIENAQSLSVKCSVRIVINFGHWLHKICPDDEDELYDDYDLIPLTKRYINRILDLTIPLSFDDIKDTVKTTWNNKCYSSQILWILSAALMTNLAYLPRNPGVSKDDLSSLSRLIKENITFIRKTCKEYSETEEFIEAYKNKSVRGILYELYDSEK